MTWFRSWRARRRLSKLMTTANIIAMAHRDRQGLSPQDRTELDQAMRHLSDFYRKDP